MSVIKTNVQTVLDIEKIALIWQNILLLVDHKFSLLDVSCWLFKKFNPSVALFQKEMKWAHIFCRWKLKLWHFSLHIEIILVNLFDQNQNSVVVAERKQGNL